MISTGATIGFVTLVAGDQFHHRGLPCIHFWGHLLFVLNFLYTIQESTKDACHYFGYLMKFPEFNLFPSTIYYSNDIISTNALLPCYPWFGFATWVIIKKIAFIRVEYKTSISKSIRLPRLHTQSVNRIGKLGDNELILGLKFCAACHNELRFVSFHLSITLNGY